MLDLTLDGPIGTVTLRRPPVNAFDLRMVELLHDAIGKAEADGVGCLVLRSENSRVFSAGADIAMLQAATDRPAGVDELVVFVTRFQEVLFRLEQAAFPTIAAIDGLALGGGLELALACDFRLIGPDARLGLTETSLGLVPGAGGTQRLSEVLGRSRARQLVLSGRVLDDREAHRLGLADRCPDGAESAAGELARDLASRPARALALAKQCLASAPSADGYQREISASRELYGNPETIDLLHRFLDRRNKKETS